MGGSGDGDIVGDGCWGVAGRFSVGVIGGCAVVWSDHVRGAVGEAVRRKART